MSAASPERTRGAAVWLPWLVVGLAGAILIGFAGLIPMSSWRADEYHDFGLFRLRGWSFFFQRLLTWSPRPLSEALAGLYFLAQEGTGRQLVTSFVALLWLTLLVGPVLYLWRAPSLSRLLLVAALLCLFLLGHGVSEVFFWPMGAVAYAPTLAAMAALTLHVVDGRWAQRGARLFCIACLLCAAGLSEVGAIFAICFAVAMIALHASGRVGRPRDALAWLAPLALGIVVMILLSLGRGQLEERVFYHGFTSNPTFLKHPLASLARAIPTYARQVFVLDGLEAGAAAIVLGAAVKIGVLLGLLALLRSERRVDDAAGSSWVRGALALSLQATVFISIAGSYYKFGLVCCERHDTMRQCMEVLTLLCGAALLRTAWPRATARLRGPAVGAALLGAALLVLMGREIGPVARAYAVRDRAVAVRSANWDSGHSAGDDMMFQMAPIPPVVGGMTPPERARYRSDEKAPWLWDLVMTFFGKREIELKPVE